ncbi:hypothetical protein [Shimia abyssi]|uniref:Cadmium resistance protein CadD (Predicted permease) n=1 Tax=Shimia abyssi TaxID=1662395 RepID=A0A2P8F6P3_9RHOB|nr:hypothetical protein [Shimia abyssi]PSL17393.1 cadmium resistance protein CadD (predicted permease) [Shimia abyssi]
MLFHSGLAASGALTLIATNLDNLAVLIALLLTAGKRSALGGFLAAQLVVLGAALVFAEGVDATLADMAGLLGVIPLGLGLWGVWQQWTVSEADSTDTHAAKGTLVACFFLFLSLSVDSFAAFAPLLADTQPLLRLPLLAGAVVALAGLALLGLILAQGAKQGGAWLSRLERLGPYAMVAVGLYILTNTATDTLV